MSDPVLRRMLHPVEELETAEVSGADSLALTPATMPASSSLWGLGRHCHHRDSCEDSVSKDEEKLGIGKVRLGLSFNSCEGF